MTHYWLERFSSSTFQSAVYLSSVVLGDCGRYVVRPLLCFTYRQLTTGKQGITVVLRPDGRFRRGRFRTFEFSVLFF